MVAVKANEKTGGGTPVLSEIIKLLATGTVAAMATIAVGYFTFAKDSRELDIKMVDIALSILSGEKGAPQAAAVSTPSQSAGGKSITPPTIDSGSIIARTFALRALRQYSNVQLSDTEIENWAKADQPLKSGIFTSTSIDWQEVLNSLGNNKLTTPDGLSFTMDCFTKSDEIDRLNLPDATRLSWQANLKSWKSQYCHTP